MQYLITADIYNFMFYRENIEINNWKLIPDRDSQSIYKRIKEENTPLPTGISELYIDCDEEFEKALEMGKNTLELYSKLLSFTENADIYFNNYKCYKIENGTKNLKLRSYYPTIIRKTWGYAHFGYNELIEYLQKSTKLILDDTFMKKTNIDRTMDWYILSQSTNVFDTKLLLLFISLEILANSWAKYDNSYYILNNKLEKSLTKIIKKGLKNLQIKKSYREQIYGNLKTLNRISIKNKTNKLCDDLGIDLDIEELVEMIKVRNMIVHGDRIIYSSELFDYNEKLDNLIKKIVYTIFGVGEHVGKIHLRSY